MKKLSSILLGIAFLFGIGVPLLKENNAKVAEATDYETVVDTFTIKEFEDTPSGLSGTVRNYTLSGSNSNGSYMFKTARGIMGSRVIDNNPQSECFTFAASGSDPDGVVSLTEFGYIRSIEIELYVQTGTGGFPQIDVYLSNKCFKTPTDLREILEEEKYATLDPNNLKINITDDFKYFGLKVPKENVTKPHLKSIKFEWELHDFSKTADIYTNVNEKLNLGFGETFKVISSAIGNGDYTDDEIMYKSSDENVFTVDKNGLITVTNGGTATLRIQFGYSYVECVVTADCFNEITMNLSLSATRLENTSDLHEGDIICIVYEPKNKVLSEVINDDGYLGRCVACNIDTDTNSLLVGSGCEYFYVAGNSDSGFSFFSNTGEKISYLEGYNWTSLSSDSSKDKWNVTIENGIATIVGKTNNNIYLTYDIECNCFDAMELDGNVAIYKFDNSGSNRIALSDTEESQDSYALSFANKFLNTFMSVCDVNGNTNVDDLKEKWNDIFFEPCDEFNNLNGISLLMLKNAVPNEDGDPIQRAVSLYEYIVGKYDELQDMNYLDRNIPHRAYYGGLMSNTLDDNADVMLILVISFSSLALCTGALLIRKKKRI